MMKRLLIILCILSAAVLAGRAPDADYWAYFELWHSSFGVVCESERYYFHTRPTLNFSLTTEFNFSCYAKECHYLSPGEYCESIIQSNHPLFQDSKTVSVIEDSTDDIRAQKLSSNTGLGGHWDLSNYCSSEGAVSLRLDSNPELEGKDPDGAPVLYVPTEKDCRPLTSCSAETLGENISDSVFDLRATRLFVSAPDILVDWDGNKDDCDCYVGLKACNNQSCFNASFAFEGGTTGPCCGDDNFGGLEPFKNREHFNYRRCGDTWDPENTDTALCDDNASDSVCCNHVNDCVYGGDCYPDDAEYVTSELIINSDNASCSYGSWCPTNYWFNYETKRCEWARSDSCYSNDPLTENITSCNHRFDTQDYWDDFYAGESRDCLDQTINPIEACCPYVDFEGATYYKYAQVKVY